MKTCPLCHSQLNLIVFEDYACPTRVSYGGQITISHYMWHTRNNLHVWMVPPYQIFIYQGKSTIYVQESPVTDFEHPNFRAALTLSEEIKPQPLDKLIQRLKTIITFS